MFSPASLHVYLAEQMFPDLVVSLEYLTIIPAKFLAHFLCFLHSRAAVSCALRMRGAESFSVPLSPGCVTLYCTQLYTQL